MRSLQRLGLSWERDRFLVNSDQREDRRMEWSTAVVERPDATLRCLDSGGKGQVLLLLHGLAGYGGEWELEQRGDGLWPRWDADVMQASLSGVTARPFWREWASTRQPTLVILGEAGIIDRGEVAHMVAVRPDVTT